MANDDGDLAHPVQAPVGDRRWVRRHLFRLLKASCRGDALRLVVRAPTADRAVAALRERYDVRFSAAARSRVNTSERPAKKFDFKWNQIYKFERTEPSYDVMEVKAKNGAVVRAEPSMGSEKVAELPKGTIVFVVRRCQIKHDGKDVARAGIARPHAGYVSARMLQPTNREPPRSYFDPTGEELELEARRREDGNE